MALSRLCHPSVVERTGRLRGRRGERWKEGRKDEGGENCTNKNARFLSRSGRRGGGGGEKTGQRGVDEMGWRAPTTCDLINKPV